MNAEYGAMQAGIDAADGPEKSKEYADVKAWFERLERARKFDEPAREQYAKDRRYARGDSGFEVDANIVGNNIDILEAFYYARNPDFDIAPGPVVRPPNIEALRDAIEDEIRASPEVMRAGQQAAALAVYQGLPQEQAMLAGQIAQEQAVEGAIQSQVVALRKRYAKRNREIKGFCETGEIIGSRMWQDAALRRRGRPWVRSGLTVGVGVLKASWQERTAPSPETTTQINDLQANIARARAQKAKLEDGNAGFLDRLKDGSLSLVGMDCEAQLAEYERQLTTLEAKPEVVESRTYVVDMVAAEDFQVAPGYTIANHLDAPWNAHRIFMSYEDACAEALKYGVKEEQMKCAVRYSARKPVMLKRESVMVGESVEAVDADAYINAASATGYKSEGGGEFVALWEIWDMGTNCVLTGIEGVKCWVKPPWRPPATTRFYPFFLLCTSEVDGQRHPQSLPSRAAKLVDEYNRIGSAEAEHRRRVSPKLMFNAGAMDDEEAKKLEKGTTAEMVAVKTTVPKMDLRGLLVPVNYPGIDAALYDRTRIINEIERIFGVQEALSGSVEVQKTATEADIQQQGFNARTGSRRDAIESVLSELATYTIEIARAFVTMEDAQAIAGPDAFWPAYTGPDDLLKLVSVDIRAGSSGKPNTTAERESWATLYPTLQAGIVQIAQLRGAAPADMADALEKLLRITAERSGERLDIDSLIPQGGGAPMPGRPGAASPSGAPSEEVPPSSEPAPLADAA